MGEERLSRSWGTRACVPWGYDPGGPSAPGLSSASVLPSAS
jgi:hypothetical protein